MTFCDVVIVGSGPAGMSAAIRLRNFGYSVTVVDEQPSPGGQIWRGIERNRNDILLGALGEDYRKGEALVASFRASGAVYVPETQVWQIEDGWKVFLTSNGQARCVRTRAVLLANGAQERPVPFSGWTLPGVMTVGAAQILLKSGGMLPQGRVFIAGAGPLPLLYSIQNLHLGANLAGYLDTSKRPSLSALFRLAAGWRDLGSLVKGLKWLGKLGRKVRIVKNFSGLKAGGEGRLEYVEWNAGGKTIRESADVLLVHEGVVPRVHETLALGCEHEWHEAQGYFRPTLDIWGETTRRTLFVAGDAGGIGGWVAAAVSGEIAALGIAKCLGSESDMEEIRREDKLDERRSKALSLRPFLDTAYPPPRERLDDDVIVCRCEEVTAGTIRKVTRGGVADPNAVKAATRCGMGPCQGRQCGYTVQAILAEAHDVPVGDVAFFNIRPPFKPVTLGEIASLEEEA